MRPIRNASCEKRIGATFTDTGSDPALTVTILVFCTANNFAASIGAVVGHGCAYAGAELRVTRPKWYPWIRRATSLEDARQSLVKRAIIENVERVIALATPEKLGTAMPFVVAPAGALTDPVTEPGVSRNVLGPYELLGARLVAEAS